MVDNMYPDNLDPSFGIPLVLMMLAGYGILVIRDRRADVKRRAAIRKASN